MRVAVNCKIKNPGKLEVDPVITINHPCIADRVRNKLIIGDKEYDGSTEVVVGIDDLGPLNANKLVQSPGDILILANGDAFRDTPILGSKGLSFIANTDGTCSLSGIGTCTDTDIIIPICSPEFDIITTISDHAFYDNKTITSITIPDSVTIIEDCAFDDCLELMNIIFEGTTNQWNAITKGDNWDTNIPATGIKCIDGDIAI